jgi:fructuronate reductase/mannitol 2-dehydrogenase
MPFTPETAQPTTPATDGKRERLNAETLSAVEARPDVQTPTYDRGTLTPSVVHISVGGFHRAHQAVYFDELAEQGERGWGVVGVGLHSPGMKDALEPQDGLYTVVERAAGDDRARIVGCVVDYVYAPEAVQETLELLASPTTRLVTMTVTGDGYRVDRETGELDTEHEEVAWDLEHPEEPRGVLGYVVGALERRRRAGTGPFTVLSCDNVPDNGGMTRTAVVAFARLRDPELASWIADEVAFPDSMVDRITPSTTDEDRAHVEREFGIVDDWPVVTEPFRQWVIEDAFCAGRPPLDRVGVQFVADVGPFQTVKKRVLNGTHCAVGYLGSLAGLATTDAVLADPDLGPYVTRLMRDELLPLLPETPGVDLERYVERTIERLANPRMGDDLSRLARRGSTKIVDYLLPSVREAVAGGTPRALLTLTVAGWIAYLRGEDDEGRTIEVQDARREELREFLPAERPGDPRPLLGVRSLFGDLGEDEAFVAAVERDLGRIARDGTRAAVRATLAELGDAAPAATGILAFRDAELRAVRTLLCDADGNLFPSEEPAFVASADVTNRFLRTYGIDRSYEAEELRLATTGMNFRSTAVALAVEHGVALDAQLADGRPDAEQAAAGDDDRRVLTAQELDDWVQEERRAVAAYLGEVLQRDDAVAEPLARMAERLGLAAVSSSATARLRASFDATGLGGLFPPDRTFSAEDSLPRPTSKPDPAVYLFACERLGVAPADTVAVEDSVPGARSAVAAGCQTLGNVAFVAEEEREERIAQLREVGVVAVVHGWDGVEALLDAGEVRP